VKMKKIPNHFNRDLLSHNQYAELLGLIYNGLVEFVKKAKENNWSDDRLAAIVVYECSVEIHLWFPTLAKDMLAFIDGMLKGQKESGNVWKRTERIRHVITTYTSVVDASNTNPQKEGEDK